MSSEIERFLELSVGATIVEGESDRRLTIIVPTHDTAVILWFVQTIANESIPEVRRIILPHWQTRREIDFPDQLLADIDEYRYGQIHHWQTNIPLVLPQAPNDYSNLVQLRASFSHRPPDSPPSIKMRLSTHGISNPLVAEWIRGFKESFGAAISPKSEPVAGI